MTMESYVIDESDEEIIKLTLVDTFFPISEVDAWHLKVL